MDVLYEYFDFKLTFWSLLSLLLMGTSILYLIVDIPRNKPKFIFLSLLTFILSFSLFCLSYEEKQMIQVVLYDDYIIDAEKFNIHKIEDKLYTLEVK